MHRSAVAARSGYVVATAVFTIVLAALLQVRYGYQAGTNDHLVLSLQGLQWGIPGFAVNDWFIPAAPQPHILFDLVTWAGAAGGRLAEVYLAWWVLGLLVGGLATAVLAQAWTPHRPILASAAVAAILGLGPETVLGSTTAALPTALPHELGGFLAYLAAALLLTRRPRTAAAALVATAVVHVQIGALMVVVGVLAVAFVGVLERRWWWSVLGGCAAATTVVVTVLRLRPVAAQTNDFVEICREVIPYHCDATTWTAGQLGSGFAVVGAALLSVVLVAHGGRGTIAIWVAAVVAPAAGLTLGVLANRYGIPVIGRLAQTTNIFRLAVLLVPFGAWGLLAGFVRLTSWRRIAWLVAAVVVGYGWLVPTDGTTALPEAPRWAGAVLAVTVMGILLRYVWQLGDLMGGVAGGMALAVLVTGSAQLGLLQPRRVDVRFVSDDRDRNMGDLIAVHVPVGEVLLVPPTLGVVRLTSGRSIVVDCKAVPYGGGAWREYRARLAALGGRDSCHSGGRPFLEVPAGSLTATALRYGARYLVLTSRDPRVTAIREEGWRILSSPYPAAGDIWLLAAPGAPDRLELSPTSAG